MMFYNDDDFYEEESVTFFLVKVFTSVNLSGKKYGNAERMIAVTFITMMMRMMMMQLIIIMMMIIVAPPYREQHLNHSQTFYDEPHCKDLVDL